MNYQETTNWMFAQLPMYQNIGKKAYKSDLSNTLLLSEYLGHPENGFKSVHVAGTNGKGSTSHMLASVLQEAGYKVGLYTSPHLKDFRERIRINGQVIPEGHVVDFIGQHKSFFETNQLSFFEMTVGLAFDYFKTEKVDIAIIEVGLGGRLDSTNILAPLVSVITNISLDHTSILGNSIELIAKEKGGIIKSNVPVVIGEYTSATKNIFETIANKKEASIWFASDNYAKQYSTDLLGDYQNQNIKTASCVLDRLMANGFSIGEKAIEIGFKNVSKNTGLLGRYSIINTSPKAICDTAHNYAGLKLVMGQLKSESFSKLHIVFGVVDDKEISKIIPLLPEFATYYLCTPKNNRGLDKFILKTYFSDSDLCFNTYNSVNEAYTSAKINADLDDLIFVGGSTFVVSEII